MGTYWATFLGFIVVGFAIPEWRAIKNKQTGDTLSENVRLWLHPNTPGGGASWLGVWLTLLGVWIWFLGHIFQWWH